MKKVLFFAVAMLSASFANAQESENNVNNENSENEAAAVSLKPEEGAFTTEVAFCPFTNSSTALENGRLNASYMITDNFAVRAGLGFGINNEKTEEGNSENKTRTSNFSFAPGVVYYFDGTSKFSPYVGGELFLGSSKTVTSAKVDGKEVEETTGKHPYFGVNAFTGMNYYFSQNLYVGVEFGIGFRYDNDKDAKRKETNFAPYAVPAVRLGWAF